MQKIQQPFTNTQLEILKAFSHNLSNEELNEFRNVLANFVAQRAIKAANKVWESNNLNDDWVDKMLHTKMRKSNKS